MRRADKFPRARTFQPPRHHHHRPIAVAAILDRTNVSAFRRSLPKWDCVGDTSNPLLELLPVLPIDPEAPLDMLRACQPYHFRCVRAPSALHLRDGVD